MEMALYRLSGETSSFFIFNQDVDVRLMEQLQYALELWSFLVIRGKLSLLQDSRVEAMKEDRRSPFEIFRAYLDDFKHNRALSEWDQHSMEDLCIAIYKAVESYGQTQEKRKLVQADLPSAKKRKGITTMDTRVHDENQNSRSSGKC